MKQPAKGPFRYVDAINRGIDIEIDSDYSQFLINRAFSYHPDTLSFINEVNKHKNLTNPQHFRMLRGAIPPRSRFSKWSKPSSDGAVAVLSKYYSISMTVAQDYVKFFTDDQLKQVEEMLRQLEEYNGKSI